MAPCKVESIFASFVVILSFITNAVNGNSGIVLTIANPESGSPSLRFIPATPQDFSQTSSLYMRNASHSVQYTNAIFYSCTVDVQNELLYLYDFQTAAIWTLIGFDATDFNNVLEDAFHRGVSRDVVKMAVDWVNNNVYWTDAVFRRINVQPGWPNTNFTQFRILIQEHLYRPYAIGVDPVEAYLFWSDVGNVSKIERSTLSGSNRKVLIYSGIALPYGLTLDLVEKRVYWVDAARDTVETITYEGNDRRIVIRISHTTFYDISLFQNTLLVTDVRFKDVKFINKVTGRLTANSYRQTNPDELYYGVTMFHQNNQPTATDYCSAMTCSHFCVGTKNGGTCMCWEGFQMNENNECEEIASNFHQGFITSNGKSLCVADIRLIISNTAIYPLTCFYNTTDGYAISTFDVDMVERKILFVIDDAIYTIGLAQTGGTPTLLISTSTSITSLALDWTGGKNVYWTTSSSINVLSLASNAENTLVNSIVQPRSLLVLPLKSKLIWIAGSTGSVKIESSQLDGTERATVVYSGHLDYPKSLTYDPDNQQLYWIDSGLIKRTELDGTNLETFSTTNNQVPQLLLVYKGNLLWTVNEIDDTRLYVTDTSDYSPTAHRSLTALGYVTSVGTVDSTLQPATSGPCEVLNGQCEQVCLPSGTNRVCECEYGFIKDGNGQGCSSTPVEDNFALVTDWTHNKIYQIDLETGEVAAIDISTQGSPTGIAFNRWTSKVVWGSTGNNQIHSAFLNGSGYELLSNTDQYLRHPDRFAIDESGNIFYTGVPTLSFVPGLIGVITPQGEHATLLQFGEMPRAIVVDTANGLLFWTDHGTTPFIAKANMDGTGERKIVTTDLEWPNGLAIDVNKKMLYYTDGSLNVIKSCSYDGICTLVLTDVDAHLMAIDLDEIFIYYTSWNNPDIKKVNRERINEVERVANSAELGRLDSIAIYKSTLAQPVNTECSARNGLGDCSTICLPTASGHVCRCPDGVNLLSNGRICEGATTCPLSVANGQFSGCLGNVLEVCSYSCDPDYEMNPSVPQLICLSSGAWDHDTSSICTAVKANCPRAIPNGQFSGSCGFTEGDVCSYTCLSQFRENTAVTSLTCLNTGSWDYNVNSLCIAIPPSCPGSIPNGNLSDGCTAEEGVVCGYQCYPGFETDVTITSLTCLSSGSWSRNINTLCTAVGPFCPASIPNGKLSDGCTVKVGVVCGYECDEQFGKDARVTSLTCLSSGGWNEDVNILCTAVEPYCPISIANGQLSDDCTLKEGVTCDYNCNEAFKKDTSVGTLICLSTGKWNADTTAICKKPAETPTKPAALYIGVGAGAGGLLLIILIVIVVVVVYKRNHRNPSGPIYSPDSTTNDFENPRYSNFQARTSERDSTYDYIGMDDTVKYETLQATSQNSYVTHPVRNSDSPSTDAPGAPQDRDSYVTPVQRNYPVT